MPDQLSTITMSGGAKVTGLPAPTVGSDAVNKTYADTLTPAATPADLLIIRNTFA